jgi:hypothetical protein
VNTSPAATEFFEDFSHGMDRWWVEGGKRVWIQEGRLYVDADPTPEEPNVPAVCTVWCKQPFAGNLRVEFDAHIVRSSLNANNINFFLHFSDPSGTPLYETRALRASADYALYHKLRGNIFTFLNDTDTRPAPPPADQKARFRIRHCPGFQLLAQAYGYHCRQGVTYRVAIERLGGRLSVVVDGIAWVQGEDSDPPQAGLIGLRTYRTVLWWDNIRVTPLGG